MADRMTKEQRHRCMASIKGKDTGPELAIRRGLHSRGYRFRIHVRNLPGTPDIVLPCRKTVIQVNGCFWHGHKNCSKYVQPRSNREFWQAKIERNRHRDEVTEAHLTALGWHVITIWECETCGKERLAQTLDKIEGLLRTYSQENTDDAGRRRAGRASARLEHERIMKRQADLEAEIDALYPLPPRIRRMAKEEARSSEDY